MSYIFAGLKRKLEVINNDSKLDITEWKPNVPYTKAIKCFSFGKEEKLHNFLKEVFEDESWESSNIKLWTESTKFLNNSVRLESLKNVIGLVPKIMLFFRPAYSVQLALRYTVRIISGVTDPIGITNILAENKDLLGYFIQYYELVKEIYTGQFLLNIEKYDKKLVRGLILGLVEIANLLRMDNAEILRILPTQLFKWGDNSVIIGLTEINESKKYTVDRGSFIDQDMMNIDRHCLICQQHYDCTETLLEHIETHNKFICAYCGVEFHSYREFVCHSVTFCRDIKLSNICTYCYNQKGKCKCLLVADILFKTIVKFTERQSKSIAMQNDLISTIAQFYALINKPDYRKDINGSYQSLIQECQELDLDISILSEENVNEILEPILPVIQIDQNIVTCKGLAVSATWTQIRNCLEEYFDSFHDAELLLLKSLKGLRTFCLFKNCSKDFNIRHHLETHNICVFARGFDIEEIPIRHENIESYIKHCYKHVINVGTESGLNCMYCETLIDSVQGMNFGVFLNHLLKHIGDREQIFDSICKHSEPIECSRILLKSGVDALFHKLLYHVKNSQSLLIYIKEVVYENNPLNNRKSKQLTAIKLSKEEKHAAIADKLNYKTNKDETEKKQDTVQIIPDNTFISNLYKKYDKDKDSETDTENEDEEDDNNTNLKPQIPMHNSFYCKNEKHKQPIHFSTSVELKKHIIETHSCSFKHCSFYAMLEKTLLQHYAVHLTDNMEAKCPICNKIVKDLNNHIKEHPPCKSCQQRFENLSRLRKHEPECTKIKPSGQIELIDINEKDTSLLIDSVSLESKFSSLIQKLLEDSNLTATEKLTGAQIVSKYTSSNALAKNRLRVDSISNRRNDSLLFDIPNFNHQDKPMLHKSLASLGDIREEEKFNPSIMTSTQNCVLNFEKLETLLKRLDTLVLIGNLSEMHAVALFQRFIAQPVQDTVTSYLQKNWEDASFKSIVEILQWVFVPLRLKVFENLVLAYRHDNTQETFLAFASKTFRHLKLCSRLKPAEQRDIYIEINNRKILKQSLPAKLLDNLEQKENLYTEFSSKEILDHYVSFVHNTNETRYNPETYRVFTTKVKSVPGTVRNQNIGKYDKKRFRENKLSKTFNKSFHKNHKVNEIKPQVNNSNIKKMPSEESRRKITLLRKEGIDVKYPICFLCLKDHLANKCEQYRGVRIIDKLCIIMKNGKRIPMGFHSECRHEQNISNNVSSSGNKVTLWKPRPK